MWSLFDMVTGEITTAWSTRVGSEFEDVPIVYRKKKDAVADLQDFAEELNMARERGDIQDDPIPGKMTTRKAERITMAEVKKISIEELDDLFGEDGYFVEE